MKSHQQIPCRFILNGNRIRRKSVEPFIFRIESWQRNIYNLQLPDRSMTAIFFDQNRHPRFDCRLFTVHLKKSAPLKNIINLNMILMIMHTCICTDLDNMKRNPPAGTSAKSVILKRLSSAMTSPPYIPTGKPTGDSSTGYFNLPLASIASASP